MKITKDLLDWIENSIDRIQGIGFGEITIRFKVHNGKVRVKKIVEEGDKEEVLSEKP